MASPPAPAPHLLQPCWAPLGLLSLLLPHEVTGQGPRAAQTIPTKAQPLGRWAAGLSYLQHLPHLLGGDGDQSLDAVLPQLPLLLDDLLEEAVNVDFALSGNLGNKYGGWEGPGLGSGAWDVPGPGRARKFTTLSLPLVLLPNSVRL